MRHAKAIALWMGMCFVIAAMDLPSRILTMALFIAVVVFGLGVLLFAAYKLTEPEK